jgi:hypothetical protein
MKRTKLVAFVAVVVLVVISLRKRTARDTDGSVPE